MNTKKLHSKKALLFLLLAVAGLAKAQQCGDFQQTWPMPGAEWTYCLYTELGDCSAKETWRVTGDSVVEYHNYNVIQPVDLLGHAVPNSGKILLTRYSNDTVYRFVNNREYVYFIFNLNEGDVFTTFRSAGWGTNGIPNYGNDSTCSSLKPLLVTSKKEIELEGFVLNEYVIKDTLFTNLYGIEGQHLYWRMIDRIGPIDTYPLIDLKETGSYNGENEDCIYTICHPYAEMSAYRDDGFEITWYVCHPTSLAENASNELINSYPNPSSGVIYIDSEEVAKVEIYNTLGQKVKTFHNTNELRIEDLPKGMYLLLILDNENTLQTERVLLK